MASSTLLWKYLRASFALWSHLQRAVSCGTMSTMSTHCHSDVSLRKDEADGAMQHATPGIGHCVLQSALPEASSLRTTPL